MGTPLRARCGSQQRLTRINPPQLTGLPHKAATLLVPAPDWRGALHCRNIGPNRGGRSQAISRFASTGVRILLRRHGGRPLENYRWQPYLEAHPVSQPSCRLHPNSLAPERRRSVKKPGCSEPASQRPLKCERGLVYFRTVSLTNAPNDWFRGQDCDSQATWPVRLFQVTLRRPKQ